MAIDIARRKFIAALGASWNAVIIGSSRISAPVKTGAASAPILVGSLTAAYAFVNGLLTKGIQARPNPPGRPMNGPKRPS